MALDAPRCVPVAVYVCTGDPDASELLADYSSEIATARDWNVVATLRDVDRKAPLASRPGWNRVLDLLSAKAVRGVVTFSVAMLSDDADSYASLCKLFQSRGAFVCAAHETFNTASMLSNESAVDSTLLRTCKGTPVFSGSEAGTELKP
ncbi:recombinase family protein [Streptomyces sp. NPDC020883]|uniref:recombinase family protein n=1 Tax=Streptomyces sp. NPDC020883 TaxID=3365099 RepID=UPI0037B62B1B